MNHSGPIQTGEGEAVRRAICSSKPGDLPEGDVAADFCGEQKMQFIFTHPGIFITLGRVRRLNYSGGRTHVKPFTVD